MFLKFVCLVFIGGVWMLGKLIFMLGYKFDIFNFYVSKIIFYIFLILYFIEDKIFVYIGSIFCFDFVVKVVFIGSNCSVIKDSIKIILFYDSDNYNVIEELEYLGRVVNVIFEGFGSI